MKSKTMAKKAKQFSLTEEEKTYLLGRKNVGGYMKALVQNDMNEYIVRVVRKRLGLEPEQNIEVDIDNGKITLKEEKLPE